MKEVIKAMKSMLKGKEHNKLSPDELDIVTGGADGWWDDSDDEWVGPLDTSFKDQIERPHSKQYKGGLGKIMKK